MAYRIYFFRYISLIALFTQGFFITYRAEAAPTGDSYLASAIEMVDTYTNYPLTFDGNSQDVVLDEFVYTRINERFIQFPGIPGGPLVTFRGGTTGHVTAWQNSGHLIEFKVSSADGLFISFTPGSPILVEFKDIDLNAMGAAGNPQAVGVYFDFNSSGNEIPYNLGSDTYNRPLGVGPHPVDPGRQVAYFTGPPAEVNSYQFANVTGNKLRVLFDSEYQFLGARIMDMVGPWGLGLTNNIDLPPIINEMKIGVLITGMPAGIQGDFDGDGDVDGRDFLIWQRGYGKVNPAPSDGDANGDGQVNHIDLGIWQDHYGETAPGPISAGDEGPQAINEELPPMEIIAYEDENPAIEAPIPNDSKKSIKNITSNKKKKNKKKAKSTKKKKAQNKLEL